MGPCQLDGHTMQAARDLDGMKRLREPAKVHVKMLEEKLKKGKSTSPKCLSASEGHVLKKYGDIERD